LNTSNKKYWMPVSLTDIQYFMLYGVLSVNKTTPERSYFSLFSSETVSL